MLDSIFGTLALVLVSFGLVYFFVTLGAGVRALHREKKTLGHQARGHRYDASEEPELAPADRPAPAEPAHVYFLVPCLDEQAVIGATVSNLLAQHPDVQVVVIDDDSDDDTARVALAAGAGRVRLVQRRAPDARIGKGPALNAGLRVVAEEVADRDLDPASVIIGVMDADGRLSVGAVSHILAMFDHDPTLGGAQLAVRIRNRDRKIPRMQDFEFWGLSAVTQMGRNTTGTVGLGGNGQFSRLAALQSLDGEPWSDSLTEDLDLGVSLLVAGWRLSTTSDASVDQEGVESLGRLLRQRTRWFQGHMTCGKRIKELWFSPNLSSLASLEICLNLLVPWLLLLVWSIVVHFVYVRTIIRWTSGAGASVYGTSAVSIAAFCAFLYLLSFLPNIVAGYVYHRRDPEVSLGRGLFYGHLSVLVNYLYYFACWRAFARILLGRRDWVKTSRNADTDQPRPAFTPAPIRWRAPALASARLPAVPADQTTSTHNSPRTTALVETGHAQAAHQGGADKMSQRLLPSGEARLAREDSLPPVCSLAPRRSDSNTRDRPDTTGRECTAAAGNPFPADPGGRSRPAVTSISGLSAERAARWLAIPGIDGVHHVVALRGAGIKRKVARQWVALTHLEPESIIAWHDAGFSAERAARWLAIPGITDHRDAQAWHINGYRPKQAARQIKSRASLQTTTDRIVSTT